MIEPQHMLGSTYQDLITRSAFAPFTPPELEVIGDASYLELKRGGLSLVLPDGFTVSAMQLHSEGHEGHAEFKDMLPWGLSFQKGRKVTRALLGSPDSHSNEVVVPILGKKPGWDIFRDNGFRIHVEYSFSMESIQLVTISPWHVD